MENIMELWLKIVSKIRKHSLVIIGSLWLLLGLFVYFNLIQGDLSRRAGKAMIIAGIIYFCYYFIRKRATIKK
jgi:hypothetical protein